MGRRIFLWRVVINRKTTKFESNSQRIGTLKWDIPCCYQSQNYKIWKQFTTSQYINGSVIALLSIAKLQNLKAIHNDYHTNPLCLNVVINRKTTKFESNSQQEEPLQKKYVVVINRKTTKFESNSQPFAGSLCLPSCCYQSQNYKIWKQFTTSFSIAFNSSCCYQSQNYKIWKQFTTIQISKMKLLKLLSITKLQNLKAIHNDKYIKRTFIDVVINRKTTKFESNSQRKGLVSVFKGGCYQSQNYKIWKQFTTRRSCLLGETALLSIAKLQNLKAIHN